MLGQVIDASGEERDLDFRRTGILFVNFVFCYDCRFNDYGGHGFIVDFHDCREPSRAPWRPPLPNGNRVEPASPFQSGGMPDQPWWASATGGCPLTQGHKLRKCAACRKCKFVAFQAFSRAGGIVREVAFSTGRPSAARAGSICELTVDKVSWASCPCWMDPREPMGETPMPRPSTNGRRQL